MKKTLAIVLALVMVLAMIPAMSAHTTEYKTITDKSYTLEMVSTNDNLKETVSYTASATTANSITFNYKWSDLKADFVDKFADDVVQAQLKINGWDTELTGATTKSVTVDGKVLDEDAADGWIVLPLEVTEAGYTDTFVITVVAEKDNKQITETAKVSVKLVNKETKKAAKTAYITNIASSDEKIMEAYIVGDKIYMDWASSALSHTGWAGEKLTITFADENKAPFTAITYAYGVNESLKLAAGSEVKLKDSAAVYMVKPASLNGAEDIQFALETKAADYLTKKYDVVVRENIADEDPRGIYFAETSKTIAMGEKFTPVVLAVANGKVVKADAIHYGTNTSKEVIDIDGATVIGTREGVAYITAEYTPFNGVKYESSSMKVVVTLPGESIPEVDPAAEIYYVTCRALNVRAGAGTSYKKVDLIHRGDAVKVVELKNGWAKLDDGTYVCAKYIAK